MGRRRSTGMGLEILNCPVQLLSGSQEVESAHDHVYPVLYG